MDDVLKIFLGALAVAGGSYGMFYAFTRIGRGLGYFEALAYALFGFMLNLGGIAFALSGVIAG